MAKICSFFLNLGSFVLKFVLKHLQTKNMRDISGISCHTCRREPSILAHFDFASESKADFEGFFEVLHLGAQLSYTVMQTKLYVTRFGHDVEEVCNSSKLDLLFC